VQSIIGSRGATIIFPTLDTWPAGRIRANRRGWIISNFANVGIRRIIMPERKQRKKIADRK
jgi:hypothetical protein